MWSDYAADDWRENCTATHAGWHNHTRQPHAFEKTPLPGGAHWEIGAHRCFDPAKDIAIPGYKPPLTMRCKPPVAGRTKWVYFAGNLGDRAGDTLRCDASIASQGGLLESCCERRRAQDSYGSDGASRREIDNMVSQALLQRGLGTPGGALDWLLGSGTCTGLGESVTRKKTSQQRGPKLTQINTNAGTLAVCGSARRSCSKRPPASRSWRAVQRRTTRTCATRCSA